MKAEYKRDMQNNYLILEASDEAEEEYRLRMAEQNEISGLLSFCSSRKDGKLYLHYEITSKQSLENVYAKKTMKYQDILFVLNGIRDVLEMIQKYLLSPDQLVFDPQYIYISPDQHRIHLCYLPGKREYPITVLAEFILKKLDHSDRQAVVLGYSFYQRSCEENFSLQKTLKEMLLSAKEAENPENGSITVHPGNYGTIPGRAQNGQMPRRIIRDSRVDPEEYRKRAGQNNKGGESRREPGDRSGQNRNEQINRSRQNSRIQENRQSERKNVRVDRRRSSGKERISDRFFRIVHPAVFLSGLFLFAVIEAVYYYELIRLTEAGGLFFLMISAETLINKAYFAGKEKKKRQRERWEREEEDAELYQELQESMYRINEREDNGKRGTGRESEPEATCFLASVPDSESMRLIPVVSHKREDGSNFDIPDILIGNVPVCIGKVKGESDVILKSPTVSRIHARLEYRDEKYFIKDLNSRNGTFLNGVKLNPQEQCQFVAGDRIRFAEIEYRATVG